MHQHKKFTPIPTLFNGILFRSKLEAIWAVFFEQMSMSWVYEPEAFGNGDTGYLPDFWLPDIDCFFEVKPERRLSETEYTKAVLLVESTNKPLIVAHGRPFFRCDKNFTFLQISSEGDVFDFGEDGYYFTQCAKCKAIDFPFHGKSEYATKYCCGAGHDDIEAVKDAVLFANSYVFGSRNN